MMDRRRALMMEKKGSGKSDMNGWTDGVAYTDITIYNNSYYDDSTGAVRNYNGWNRTGLIPCQNATYIRFPKINHNIPSDLRFNWLFDNNGQPLQTFALSASYAMRIDVPANGAFFALSMPASVLTQALSDGITPHA